MLVHDARRPGGFFGVTAVHLLVTAAGPLEVVSHPFQAALRSARHVAIVGGLPSLASLASLLQSKLASGTLNRSRRVERLQQVGKNSVVG